MMLRWWATPPSQSKDSPPPEPPLEKSPNSAPARTTTSAWKTVALHPAKPRTAHHSSSVVLRWGGQDSHHPKYEESPPSRPTKNADQHLGNTSKRWMQQAFPHRAEHRRHPRSGPANHSTVCGISRSLKRLKTRESKQTLCPRPLLRSHPHERQPPSIVAGP